MKDLARLVRIYPSNLIESICENLILIFLIAFCCCLFTEFDPSQPVAGQHLRARKVVVIIVVIVEA